MQRTREAVAGSELKLVAEPVLAKEIDPAVTPCVVLCGQPYRVVAVPAVARLGGAMQGRQLLAKQAFAGLADTLEAEPFKCNESAATRLAKRDSAGTRTAFACDSSDNPSASAANIS